MNSRSIAYQLPEVGKIYKKNCELREVVRIHHTAYGAPDIFFRVLGERRERGLFFPFWLNWAEHAELLDTQCDVD